METDELTCNICFEHFEGRKRLPKILTCGHTFCSNCLDSVLTSSKRCATCRKDIKYNSSQEIPVNYVAKSLAERELLSSKPDTQVGFCNEHRSPENWNCKDCKQMVCGSCVVMHHKHCQTEYIDVEKRRKLMKEFDTIETEAMIKKHNFSELTLEEPDSEEPDSEEPDTEEPDSEEPDSEEAVSEEPDSEEPDSEEPDSEEPDSEEPDSSLHAQLPSAPPFEDLNLSISPPVTFENVMRRLENGDLIHAVETSDNIYRFGCMELKNGKIRINSFDTEPPVHPCNTIPFRQFLSSLKGSTQLPDKVFFQIQGFKEELIVKTDEALAGSPRVLNFLYFTSGLKGPSYKNTKLEVGVSIFWIDCPWMKNGEEIRGAVVEGITDGGIYEAPFKKGFIYGEGASSGFLSSVAFCTKDMELGKLFCKFAKVVSGFKVLDQIKIQMSQVHLVENCGFVIG